MTMRNCTPYLVDEYRRYEAMRLLQNPMYQVNKDYLLFRDTNMMGSWQTNRSNHQDLRLSVQR